MAKRELEVLVDFLKDIELAASAAKDELRVLMNSTPDPDPEPEPDPEPDPKPTDFKTFHIIDHRGQPDLRQFGLEPLKIWYEGAFFDNKDRDADVNVSKVRSAARGAPLISCPDIERWADKNTWQVSKTNIERYVDFCIGYGANLPSPDHKFGLYSILPVRNYFDAVGDKGPSGFAKWQRWNDEVKPIALHVDMLFPSLYTFSSVFEGSASRGHDWERYASANIAEARRIAPGKPVYPFLWPWYHPSANTPIEPSFWRTQLELCREQADGFVIWDDLTKTKTDWGSLPPWWDETVDFMRGL